MKTVLSQTILAAIKNSFEIEDFDGVVNFERPASGDHGDWSTNVAMVGAKQLRMSPRDIATKLAEYLNTNLDEIEFVAKVEVAGPGFINFYLKPEYYLDVLGQIDENYGSHELGDSKKVMIEFGQPNTHKAFHVGHLKSAISGLSIVRLYENLGYEVVKANFYGDVGMHVAKCTWGAMDKGFDQDKLAEMDMHERMKIIDGFYVHGSQQFKESEAVEAEIRSINKEIYVMADTKAVDVYKLLRDWSLEHQEDVFNSLGFEFDRQYPESEVFAEALEIVNKHTPGLFEESEGAIIFRGENKGLNNWVFVTGEGNPTYEAKDLALAYKKFAEYNPDLSIITTSAEQIDRFRAIIYCLEQIDSKFTGRYIHLPFGWMLRGGKKQSSRMGESVKGMDILVEAKNAADGLISAEKNYSESERAEIVDRVGQAGLKFLILSHEFHKDINYDPDEFVTLEGFSGPYVMYAYARAKTLMNDGGDIDYLKNLNYDLSTPSEMQLLKLLAKFPDITELAARSNAPHHVAHYIYQLANAFNQFYAELPILKEEDEAKRFARLKIVRAVSIVLQNGLHLLGIKTLERM